MNIEKRVENLENLVTSLLKRIDNDKHYETVDKNGIRNITSENIIAIADNSDAIFELASLVAEMEESNG